MKPTLNYQQIITEYYNENQIPQTMINLMDYLNNNPYSFIPLDELENISYWNDSEIDFFINWLTKNSKSIDPNIKLYSFYLLTSFKPFNTSILLNTQEKINAFDNACLNANNDSKLDLHLDYLIKEFQDYQRISNHLNMKEFIYYLYLNSTEENILIHEKMWQKISNHDLQLDLNKIGFQLYPTNINLKVLSILSAENNPIYLKSYSNINDDEFYEKITIKESLELIEFKKFILKNEQIYKSNNSDFSKEIISNQFIDDKFIEITQKNSQKTNAIISDFINFEKNNYNFAYSYWEHLSKLHNLITLENKINIAIPTSTNQIKKNKI